MGGNFLDSGDPSDDDQALLHPSGAYEGISGRVHRALLRQGYLFFLIYMYFLLLLRRSPVLKSSVPIDFFCTYLLLDTTHSSLPCLDLLGLRRLFYFFGLRRARHNYDSLQALALHTHDPVV